jgi:hypothetical protein
MLHLEKSICFSGTYPHTGVEKIFGVNRRIWRFDRDSG